MTRDENGHKEGPLRFEWEQGRLRLKFEGAKRVYGLFCVAPPPEVGQHLGCITVTELAELTEFLLFGVFVALRTMPPELLDRVYDQLTPGTKRHLLVDEKSGIVVAR